RRCDAPVAGGVAGAAGPLITQIGGALSRGQPPLRLGPLGCPALPPFIRGLGATHNLYGTGSPRCLPDNVPRCPVRPGFLAVRAGRRTCLNPPVFPRMRPRPPLAESETTTSEERDDERRHGQGLRPEGPRGVGAARKSMER